MADNVSVSKLAAYATVVKCSMRYGVVVRGTEIKNGTRYASIINLTNAIPTSIQIGKFQLRLYCDQNRKSRPHGGGATQQPETHVVSHMVWECQNEMCRHCSRTGHKQTDCDEHRVGKTVTAMTGEYIYHLANSEEAVDDAELVELSDHGEGEDEMLGVGDHDRGNMVILDSDCSLSSSGIPWLNMWTTSGMLQSWPNLGYKHLRWTKCSV